MKSTLHFNLHRDGTTALGRYTIRQRPPVAPVALVCACGCGTVFARRGGSNGRRAFVDRAHWARAVKKGR